MDINCDVWSITSFNELARGGLAAERSRYMNNSNDLSYVERCFLDELPTIAVSEYMRNYPEQIRRFIKGDYICLGTDGFGRSDTRENLRQFFEIDKDNIVYAALIALGNTKLAKSYADEKKLALNKEHPWQK